MPNQVGTAFVGVEFDRAGIRQALNGLQGDVNRSAGAFSKAGKRMGQGLKVGIAAGIAGVGVAAVGIGKAIDAASDLNEEMSKSQVVFGKASKGVLAWSETASKNLGLSRQEALSAAGAYGNMFKTIGLGDRPAADMSKRFVGLAADMASFHNADPSDMLDKLRSGLSGEAEPLRQYGVLLSEARVQQEAYRSGIAKAGSTLTEQQKVQARYSLILRDTSKAQGDIERTSGSFANQQRKMRAQWIDLQASIGQKFLPIAVKAITFLNTEGPKAFRALQDAFAGIQRAIGPFVSQLVTAIGQNLPQLFARVKEAVLPFVEAMRDFLPRAIAIAAETFQNLWPTIQQVAGFLIEAWGQLAQVTAQAWGRIIAVLEQNRGKLKNIFDALNTIIRALLPVVKFVFQTFLIPLLKLVFVQILPRAINVAIGALDVLASAIKITARVVQGFASGVSAAWNKARAIFEGVKSAVTGAFSGASSWLTNAGKEVVQGFVNGARAVFGAVRSALATIRSSVTRAVSGAAKWLYSAGREIITGFISGIRSMAGSIISAIRETITDKLPGYVKKALGISSPSKVFEEIGRQLGLGLAKGIRDHKAEVLKAAREVVRALIQAAPSAAEQVASAFAPIGDTLSRAFSQKQAAQKTPAEVQLQQIQDARAEAQRQEALQAAQHNLLIAKTDEERTAAEKEVADALYEIRVAALEKQAETERQALEDQQFVEQQSFDARLAALQTFLANVKNTTAQKQAEIGTFLSDFGLGGMSAILQQSIAAAMPALTAALDAMATEYEKAVARVKKAQKELRAAQQNVVKITGQVTKRVRRRRRSQGATGESGGGAAVATAGLLGAGDTGSGLTGPVPIGQDLARTLNRVLPSIAEAPEPEFEVRVFIGDQELRGLVRTEVRRSDDATARLILAQSAGVA